jgi:hypothetical protein
MGSRARERSLASRVASIVVVAAGVGLATVPTLYTMYPEWTRAHHERRLLVTIGWFACAGVVGLAAGRRDLFVETIARSLTLPAPTVGNRREEAYYSILDSLLKPAAHGLSTGFRFSVYRPDAAAGRTDLVPLKDGDAEEWESWQPGHGAVGVVWENLDSDPYLLLFGDRLHDPRLALSPAQQAAYGHLTMVAAKAMHDEDGRPVGVLSVASDEVDADTVFLTEDGPSIHEKLAEDLGVLIGDLFLGGDNPPV